MPFRKPVKSSSTSSAALPAAAAASAAAAPVFVVPAPVVQQHQPQQQYQQQQQAQLLNARGYPQKPRVFKRWELMDDADVRVSIIGGKVVTRISTTYDLEEQRPALPLPLKRKMTKAEAAAISATKRKVKKQQQKKPQQQNSAAAAAAAAPSMPELNTPPKKRRMEETNDEVDSQAAVGDVEKEEEQQTVEEMEVDDDTPAETIHLTVDEVRRMPDALSRMRRQWSNIKNELVMRQKRREQFQANDAQDLTLYDDPAEEQLLMKNQHVKLAHLTEEERLAFRKFQNFGHFPNPAAQITIDHHRDICEITTYVLVSGFNQRNQREQHLEVSGRVRLNFHAFSALVDISAALKAHVLMMDASTQQMSNRILSLAGKTLSHMIFTRVGPFSGVHDPKVGPIYQAFLSAYSEFMGMCYTSNLLRQLHEEIKEDEHEFLPRADLLNLMLTVLGQVQIKYIFVKFFIHC